MYRAIALFEYGNEDVHDRVRSDMLILLNLQMMQHKDPEVKKLLNQLCDGLKLTNGSI